MISKELLSAPDLEKGSVYGPVDGGRKIVATIYRSKSLGLEEREEIPQAAKSEESSQAASPRGRRTSGAGKGADDTE
jgi:hypothetical protein